MVAEVNNNPEPGRSETLLERLLPSEAYSIVHTRDCTLSIEIRVRGIELLDGRGELDAMLEL